MVRYCRVWSASRNVAWRRFLSGGVVTIEVKYMVGGIVSQVKDQAQVVHEASEPLHELGAARVIFRAVIQVEQQGPPMGKTLCDHQPSFVKAVHQQIGGHRRGGQKKKEFMVLR